MTKLETALRLNSLGMVPVLIHAGQKRPIGDGWQERRYSDDDLRERFGNNPDLNIGLLLGPASGVIDLECDGPDSPADLAELFDNQIPSTPGWAARRGAHYLFAWDDRLAAIGKAVVKWKTVEIRLGTGDKAAQSLLPPSTTDGFTRQWTTPLDRPAPLPESVIQKLLAVAEKPKPAEKPQAKHPVDDDFCRSTDWRFLEAHGWRFDGEHLTRPGKSAGASASVCKAEDGTPLLHVFSTNAAPFAADANYNAFDAYALLNHAGDSEAARADLVAQGFGRLRIPLISCAELDGNSYETEYLVKDTLVAGQPTIVAGPKKALKTSLLIDLAISLATGKPFLRRLSVKRPCKVIILSGESGLSTLQETARRIAKSIGVPLAGIGNLVWSTFLPTFDDARHLDALERSIQETGCEVLIVDPAYLCMPGTDAANLFIQGSLLRHVSEICQRHGVGLILAHHTRKRGKARNQNEYEAPELDDMAWAGFAEFARQWLLIGRREEFVPGSGEHRLWLSVGGSAGHSALWAVDVDEGISGMPRHWVVTLSTADDARTEKKLGTIRQRLIDAAREFPSGETKTAIFETAKLKSDTASRTVFDSLVNAGELVPRKVPKNGQSYDGFALAT